MIMNSFRVLRPSRARMKAMKKHKDWKAQKKKKELEESRRKIAERSQNKKLIEASDLSEVKEAVKKGANVNAHGVLGFTALMHASYKGDTDAVKDFIEKGAPVDTKDAQGRTALMMACAEGHWNAADILLEKGADINATDGKHRTPLMYAAMCGHENVVRELVNEFELNTGIRDYKGRSATKMASDNGYTTIERIIKGLENRNHRHAFQARVRRKFVERNKDD